MHQLKIEFGLMQKLKMEVKFCRGLKCFLFLPRWFSGLLTKNVKSDFNVRWSCVKSDRSTKLMWMIARVLSSTQGANNTMMSTSLMSLALDDHSHSYLVCLLLRLAIPMSCYISNVFYYLFVFFFSVVLAGRLFFCFTNDC